MKRLSARPHHVGSPYGKENAEFMAGLFRSWGYDARDREVRRALPDAEDARAGDDRARRASRRALAEPALKEDATSGQTAEQLPTYNAYSIDGDVTGAARLRQLRRARATTRSWSGAAST